MKTLLLSLFILLISAHSLFSQSESPVCKDLSAIVEMENQARASLLNFRSAKITDNYDLKYHRLEWTIDPAVFYIEGKVTSYFVPQEADFQQIYFDLSNALNVSAVTYHGQMLQFVQVENDLLKIDLPVILPSGQLDSVSVSYAGVPPQTAFGSFSQSTHQGAPIIWTLSEPYGAKDWWPCKQDLNDKIDSIDVLVLTPPAYRVASNGLLVEEKTQGNKKLYHWRHRHPIPAYLIAIGVTNYAVFSDFVPVENGDPIEVLNYVYPENLNQIRNQVGSTVAIMKLYNELVGLYPFADEKYGHAQFGYGGGMEHQTMSFMGGWSFSLQAHELAHQWFGDKVTCGSWQDIWLNEGFATYLTGLTYENGLGTTNWQAWLEGTIRSVTSQLNGSVWVADTTNIGRIFSSRLSYSKGAMLLHMLRWKLGDEHFFQAVRNYLNDPSLAYGYARTQDLQAHLETQSGQHLSEFFKDWYYGEGYPSYVVNWIQKSNQNYQVQIFQHTSHTSVDFFEMPVPIQFKGEGEEHLLVFDHRFSGQVFDIELPITPEVAIFDPERWLISKDNVVENQPVATKEIEALQQRLQLYPNPAQDQLTLSFQDWPEMPRQLELLNMQGQLIRHFTALEPRMEINITALPAGEYVFKIRLEVGTVSRAFVKNSSQ